MITLTREQLEERLAALHRASLELVQDISLESLLERIAIVACEQVAARYAAVGVLNENGELDQFIPIGMTPAEIRRMASSSPWKWVDRCPDEHPPDRPAGAYLRRSTQRRVPSSSPQNGILPGCSRSGWVKASLVRST